MELACNSYSLRGLGRREAFRALRGLDLPLVELWAGHAPYGDRATRARDVRRDADDAGVVLRAYCIGGLFGLPEAIARERLARALGFAADLGCDLVTAILDRAHVPHANELAEAHGIRIALENHWYTELARPEDVAAALAPCAARLGAAIDTGHFAFLGYEAVVAAHALRARAMHVHAKVVRRPGSLERALRRMRRRYRMEAAAPGDGDGFDAFVATLGGAGYRGLVAIEDEGDGDRAAVLAAYRDRLRGLVASWAEARRAPERAHA